MSDGILTPQSDKVTYTVRKSSKPEIDFHVRFELLQRPKTHSYALKFSSDIVLEGAWIACSAPIQFLSGRSASYEMTRTESDAELKLGNKFSATLRLKPNCKSAEFSFRAVDGYVGALEIFVSAVNNTGRVTQRESVVIAPLSSYCRIDKIDETRSYNVVKITGQFSPLKVQAWMELCFQDVDRMGYKVVGHEADFAFESMLLGCHLHCHIDEHELVFRCENPSSIAILMQFLTRQATSEKIKLDIRPSVSKEACLTTLNRVDQILAPIRGQNNIRNLTEAVAEVAAAEGGDSMFHPLFRSDGWRKLQGKDSAVAMDTDESATSVAYMNDKSKNCRIRP
ncbi:putative Bardet-Biedl syndrome 7 protein-like protein [Hypsibius exemplaris]|uniref:Bardet-Biedl syndrome 7 protein-like protein n=1 Tax=Hypsibius exemplaris TaxID=2072580 RepID=A0A1W0WZA1_HYPEX|nr:putative Bardet-Biedl syndrome 7 protein-like protein [Hypsibius exemplaris]